MLLMIIFYGSEFFIMTKDEIRIKMKEIRKHLTDEYIKKSSFSITKKIISLPEFKNSSSVCVFISAFNEPDTKYLIKACKEQNKTVYAPVTDVSSGTLSLYRLTDELHSGAYGIMEPSISQKADPNDIDIFIVPGLAFDKKGERIGFGGGYYDKILKNSRSFKIGICYSFQYLDVIPHEKYDITMDIVVTENN